MNRLADEQKRRNKQSQERWNRFLPHRRQVTRLLVDAAPTDGALCVLGAGNCNDVDLKRISSRYREVHLVDLDTGALEAGVIRQELAHAQRVCVHGNVDVTRVANLLAQGTPDNPISDADLDQCLWSSASLKPLEISAPVDTVASVCLLSQLLDATAKTMGQRHPRYVEMTMHLRSRHLKLLVDLVRPGGTAVLVLDFVSSLTCPDLPYVPEHLLQEKAVELIRQQNFFTGLNPFIIQYLFLTDPELAPHVASAEVTEPWLWDLGPRAYLVCVRGMTDQRWIYPLYRPRLALSLFDPETGNWYINWNPVTDPNPSASCTYGAWFDVPLGGLGSTYKSGFNWERSGYAVYRSTQSNTGTTYFRDANGVCGSGTSYAYSHAFARPKSTVAVLRDMTGDFYPEVMVADPNTLQVHILTSESNYANSTHGTSTIPVFNLNHRAVIL